MHTAMHIICSERTKTDEFAVGSAGLGFVGGHEEALGRWRAATHCSVIHDQERTKTEDDV